MQWIKKPIDTFIILAAFGLSIPWMNGKFNDINKRSFEIKTGLFKFKEEKLDIYQELEVIKTVLIMKNIMPLEWIQVKKIESKGGVHEVLQELAFIKMVLAIKNIMPVGLAQIKEIKLKEEIAEVHQNLAVIKTVLVMKNIMPLEWLDKPLCKILLSELCH